MDLEIAGYDPYYDSDKYYFDENEAWKPFRFLPQIKQSKGSNDLLKLANWQEKLTLNLFGWRDKETHKRRYSHVYVEIPRKNGKSTYLGFLSLYFTLLEKGADVLLASSTKELTNELFEAAYNPLILNQRLGKQFQPRASRKTIYYKKTLSKLRAIACEGSQAHSLNCSLICFDELHTLDNSPNSKEFWAGLNTGQGSRSNPLFFIITTAGNDKESICYQWHETAVKVRDKLIKAPHILPVIYQANENDDLYDKEVQLKSNPGIGTTTSHDALNKALDRAKHFPHELADVKRLHFNIWQDKEAVKFINLDDWNLCSSEPISDDILKTYPCYASFDLSCVSDLTNFCCLWEIDGKYVFKNYPFAPEESDTVQANINKHREWLKDPLANYELHEGKRINYKRVIDLILSLDLQFKFEAVAYDRYNASMVVTALEEHNIKCVAWGQTFIAMNDCCKSLERLIVEHKINHLGNPIAKEHATKATVLSDKTGNIKIVKPEYHKVDEKVDIIVSMAMALGLKNTIDAPATKFFA